MMSSEPAKPVLMNYMKQKNYRERKAKSTACESTREKAVRRDRDRLRYISTKKLPNIMSRIKNIKAEKKNIRSKTKKNILSLNLAKLTAEMKFVKAELASLKSKISSKK